MELRQKQLNKLGAVVVNKDGTINRASTQEMWRHWKQSFQALNEAITEAQTK